ncbi:FRG domain-containing protein [Vibrio parahaemolyticus]|uniref:FRG domain-containing protein n=1 Tax=Vibrio parahaemolyticus TaxID=670 RepID=UPI00113220B4|nr:FRG domain-containing protein [Vibrio parahaemolyticus]HCG6770825.1 FRG domain-containing protein [Vibrio parahaemolyticus]HCG8749474.1 FRG domain-containing protein [Vibrio parahaemolyticus]
MITNFNELHKALSKYKNNSAWVFRGHGHPDWELKPKVGRKPYSNSSEEVIFKAWKRRANEFIREQPKSDWEWLAIAQHHGLATKLLDWSYNPLVAAFFAVSGGDEDLDAKIFCYKCMWEFNPEKVVSPFEINGAGKFKPTGVVPRIIRQGGVFTVSSDPNKSIEELMRDNEELEVITISKDYRKALLEELNFYGINTSSIYPDLDGLSSHMNWIVENNIYNLAPEKI